MMSPWSRLESLLPALFDDGEQMMRFARYAFGESVALKVDPGSSAMEQASQLVDQLRSYDLVDEAFFQTLREYRPDRREDIDEVRDALLESDATKGPVALGVKVAPAPVDPDRGAWRRHMADLLAQAPEGRLQLPDPWMEAAAVVPSFDPLTLQPVGPGREPPRDLLERLAAVCETQADGRLSLNLSDRQETLARLWREGRLSEALDAQDHGSHHGKWLRRALEQGAVDTLQLRTLADLRVALQWTEWLARSDFQPFDRDRVASVLERYRRVEPLRKLIGKHFRGRDLELGRLNDHLRSRDEEPLMVLWGVGGVGKSTLLGKVLLDLEKKGEPWVYLDFDDPELDPLDPRRLVELIARRLGQFFAGASVAEAFLAVEFAAAEDDSLRFEIHSGATLAQLLATIDQGLRRLPRPPSLGLVFDTFEQVQVRGEHAVGKVRELIGAVTEALPYARVVVSGRARVRQWGDGVKTLGLEELDEPSAEAVLEALDVDDHALRHKVIERVGTNPLSLRLAADALKSKVLHAQDLESMVIQARRFEMQGQLYTRILGHIRDSEVRRLAHPGLIVRRVTVGVIRDVLAELCELDPARAEEIFQRLPDHVALFEPDEATDEEGKALRHRQDVRELMLRLMVEDPAWQDRLDRIHTLAVEHYAPRTDDLALAEQLYHRLMRDDDPEVLDGLWKPELVNPLSRCWEEPLPDRARAWLGPRIGRSEGDEDAWRTRDWEALAAREAKSRLDSGDVAGALDVLAQRSERSPGSPLHGLEARALASAHRWRDVETLTERVLADDVEALPLADLLNLHLWAGRAALELEDAQGLETHTGRALDIASASNSLAGRLQAWELRALAEPEGDGVRNLEQVFLKARDAELLEASELVHRILDLLRPHSMAVLRKTASVFGNRVRQNVIRQDAFRLEDLLHQVEGSELGKVELSKLADEVGLPKQGFDLQSLASQSIRHGKMGDALVTVLDHAGDDEGVRLGAQDMLRDFKGKRGF